MHKGIFWYIPMDRCLVSVKVSCERCGESLEPVKYSSKSGENFNHKSEWARLPPNITRRFPYNYFPRGRVEIKQGKATIYLNPVLCQDDIQKQICMEFGLDATEITIRFIADGSAHYEALMEL